MSQSPNRSPFQNPFALSIQAALSQYDVSRQDGLSQDEARQRLETTGPNQLRGKKSPSLLAKMILQLRSFLILILAAAVLVSIWVGDWIEASVILTIILLNALVGALQERKAERALQSLKRLAAPDARVRRDGITQLIPARDLVPGDLVFLEAGSVVPADLRLIESSHLQMEEASLTGESAPVIKDATIALNETTQLADRINCAFASTKVTYGRGIGVVTDTGHATQVGRIATLLEESDDPPPLQRKLESLGKVMGGGVLIICGLIFLVGILRNADVSTLFSQGFSSFWASQREIVTGLFIVAVSLAVAAVPEGLPAVVTMTLALGTQKMLSRNTLVRRLPSVETLGSATVICTDKTGTLTQNRMTVKEAWTIPQVYTLTQHQLSTVKSLVPDGESVTAKSHAPLSRMLTVGLLCNDAQLTPNADSDFIGDPTEGALLIAAQNAGLDSLSKVARLAEVPFDSKRKRMTTVHDIQDLEAFANLTFQAVALIKGAVDGILPLCTQIETSAGPETLSQASLATIQAVNHEMGKRGLRVLAMAYRPLSDVASEPSAGDIENDLTFLGLVAMQDPPRQEVAEAVAIAKSAGLRTIMITGDHAVTAAAIARQIGILRPDGVVMEGAFLESLSTETLSSQIDMIDVFARVSPQHKVRIIEALRSKGHIVAMTGDGVNDAPALKKADIGIAMGITGTDVAKDSADMVLVDDNYASIISAIEQGRIIYDNIRKSIFYLLTCNLAEIAILFVATMLGWPAPLTAIQLLWLNLVTDGAPALALALEKGEPGIMARSPRQPGDAMIDRSMLRGFLVQSTALAASILGIFMLARQGVWAPMAGTMAFATLVLAELFRAYSVRSEDIPLLRLGWRSNRWMQVAVISSAGLLLLVLYVPPLPTMFESHTISMNAWALILPFALIPMLATEGHKIFRQARKKRAQV